VIDAPRCAVHNSVHLSLPHREILEGNVMLTNQETLDARGRTMPKEAKKRDELFHEALKDIYFARKEDRCPLSATSGQLNRL
jgi:hypothetical protein